jgi:excinuclease ABC subunit C
LTDAKTAAESESGLKYPDPFDSKAFLARLTQRPGVYQMKDAKDQLLYIGKAKNLKKRVSSYFRATGLTVKTQALVGRIAHIDITVTNSETEALLLEQNLIKEYRPPYNILLRDDKSYPYIFVSDKDTYPLLTFHRGSKRKKGRYFGPYPSRSAVNDTLNILQKVFRIRQCDDTFFKNRSRPCLQFQIERCSAPCVKAISEENYAEDVKHAMQFLEGKSHQIMHELGDQMEAASAKLDFERAAAYRDQISNLQLIQQQQFVTGDAGDADVIGCALQPGGVCIHLLFVRGGRIVGSKAVHPKVSVEDSESTILSAFIAQWYIGSARELPDAVIASHPLDDQECLEDALRVHRGKKVQLTHRVKAERAGWQKLALTNAEQQLNSHLASKQTSYQRFLALQEAFGLDETPTRLECFDISHSSGEATVASCVVFDHNGPLKKDYRHFNIEDITAGDDYAAMKQALTRRYTRIKKGEGALPDILFIDGGKGQVTQAIEVMESLQITEVCIIGVAKGVTRKAGFETLIIADTSEEVTLAADSAALHLVQHIRDEAHRFAITGHRARRGKARKQSSLEGIPGVGPKRRRELLKHFGGLQAIERASIAEIAKVSTISTALAEEIYGALHPEN